MNTKQIITASQIVDLIDNVINATIPNGFESEQHAEEAYERIYKVMIDWLKYRNHRHEAK